MLERTYNNLVNNYKKKDIYISTSNEYVELTKEILPELENIIVEKEAIGTFGAILNIAVYLKEIEIFQVLILISRICIIIQVVQFFQYRNWIEKK